MKKGQIILVLFLLSAFSYGKDCSGTSTGLIPLTSFSSPVGTAPDIQPINGRIVMASLGMSNAEQEFASFMSMVNAAEGINPDLYLVNMAYPMCLGRHAKLGGICWEERFPSKLAAAGVDPSEVQILWFKFYDSPRNYSGQVLHDWYVQSIKDTLIAVQFYLPNVKQIYISGRIYAGYADPSTTLGFEPAPWATGPAVDQVIGEGGDFHWLSWGPYLWADGLSGRPQDDLIWTCDDFESDGIHPSSSGEAKVGTLLLDYLSSDPYASQWFLANPGTPPDPPQNLTIDLAWDPNSEPDLAGYNIYRSDTSGSGYLRLNSNLIPDPFYVDDTVVAGQTYYYVVTAVNLSALESGPSNEVMIVVPPDPNPTPEELINQLILDVPTLTDQEIIQRLEEILAAL